MVQRVPGFERTVVYERALDRGQQERVPTTPGMKYQHYAPTAPVVLVHGSNDGGGGGGGDEEEQEFYARILHDVEETDKDSTGIYGCLVVVKDTVHSQQQQQQQQQELSWTESVRNGRHLVQVRVTSDQQLARHLFAAMRWLDEWPDMRTIFVMAVDCVGVGRSVMNRLEKAATRSIGI
jgi:L-threonylcarbamoyladenylate synthase